MPKIDDLAGVRVAVVGDATKDHWIVGDVTRLSPEEPVPVLSRTCDHMSFGGAANVLANLHAIKCRASMRLAPTRMVIRTRFMTEAGHHFLRLDDDTPVLEPLNEADEDILFSDVLDHNPQVLVISDYAKGVCTPALCQRLLTWSRGAGVPSIVDPKGRDWSKYKGATIITPNLREWLEADQTTVGVASHKVVKIGRDGVTYDGMGGGMLAGRAKAVVDATGAGDTVTAFLAAAIGAGYDSYDAAVIANAAAGVVVGKPFTATCTLDELKAALNGDVT